MRFWAATLLCGATGCAQIFGLDTTTGGPDANLDRTSLQVTKVSIGASVARNPANLSMLSADFYTDDGAGGYALVPGENGPVDQFSAAIMTGTPPVQLTTADMVKHWYALPARQQKVNFSAYEHPNAVAPDPASAIMLSSTLPSPYVAADSFQMFVVGAWTQHGLTAMELPVVDMGATTIATTIPYTAFGNVFGGTFKSSITASDVVLLLRYTSNVLSGVLQAQFDQTAGTDPVSGTMTAVPAAQSINAAIDPTGYGTRYSAVRPATAGLSMSWRLAACPGASVAADGGSVRLNSGGASMANTMITASYGNPFESLGWKTLLTFSTSSSRSPTFMGVAVPLTAQMTTVTEPAAGLTLDLPTGLPITVRANLTPLTADNTNLALDLTKPVSVDAIFDKALGNLYGVTLVEVAVAGTTLTRTTVADAVTATDPTFKLPPALFQVGHSYYLEYRTIAGAYPNAAMGDLQTITLPYTSALLDSGIFTVVAP